MAEGNNLETEGYNWQRRHRVQGKENSVLEFFLLLVSFDSTLKLVYNVGIYSAKEHFGIPKEIRNKQRRT